MEIGLVVLAVFVVAAVVVIVRSLVLVPQAQAAVIERLGRYTRTISGQLAVLVPFVDRVRARVDLREQVVSFPPQPVITQDNLTVNIDTVVYFQVTRPEAAVYEISDYVVGVEQITTTTLRNVVGGMTLEETLTSREEINSQLRGVLDEATSRWGLRVARVELKSIFPPPSIQESMEKQMKADREKRATILSAEGHREAAIKSAEGDKASRILLAEGERQAAILSAEADRQSEILRAEGRRAASYLEAQGEAKAIETTFSAIKTGKPTPELLASKYLETLPEMASGDANKVWVVPSDFNAALQGFMRNLGTQGGDGVFRFEPTDEAAPPRNDIDTDGWFDTPEPVQPVVVEKDPVDDPATSREAVRSKLAAAAATSRAAGAPSQSQTHAEPTESDRGTEELAGAQETSPTLSINPPQPSPYQVQPPEGGPQHA